MHLYRARGAIIDWERVNPASAPSPSPSPEPAEWELLGRSPARTLEWWSDPESAAPPPPAPSPAPGHWDLLARDSERMLHWYASPETVEPATPQTGRIVGRGRMRILPKQDDPEEAPKPTPVPAPGPAMSLLGNANDLTVTKARETITMARVAERKLKAAVQKQNIEAIERALMEWF